MTYGSVQGFIDRNKNPVKNEEGNWIILVEPKRKRISDTDNESTTSTASSEVPTSQRIAAPGIDINYFRPPFRNSSNQSHTTRNYQQELQLYTASYAKDESSEDETALVTRRKYVQNKSILNCSTVHTERGSMIRYWHTLGKCHISAKKFKWDVDTDSDGGSTIKYNPDLGRAFYTGFSVCQNNTWTSLKAGDFVWRRLLQDNNTTPIHSNPDDDIIDPGDAFPKMFRIISIFQALKSYRGKWSGNDVDDATDIQKRGHPYMIVCPIYPTKKMLDKVYKSHTKNAQKSKRRKRNEEGYCEVALGADCNNAPGRIFLLPLWISEPGVLWQKIDVHVALDMNAPIPPGTKFVCYKELTRDFHTIMRMKVQKKPPTSLRVLSSSSDMLTTTNPTGTYSPKKWENFLYAEHVQFITHARRFQVEIPNHFYDTSDDSDGFDLESEYLNKLDDEFDDESEDNKESSDDDDYAIPTNITPRTLRGKQCISPRDKFLKQQSLRPNPEEILPRLVVQGDVESISQRSATNLATNNAESQEAFLGKINELIHMGIVENGLSEEISDKLQGIHNDVLRDLSVHRPITEFLNVQNPLGDNDTIIALQEEGRKKKTTNEMYHDKVNALREELGYTNGFRYPQAHVCVSALFGLDTIFVAPTGHGKSLCFAVPALHKRDQITLVIEPLKVIIDDQIQKFANDGKMRVQKLQSIRDVLHYGGVSGERVLEHIANKMQSSSMDATLIYDGPVVLFCTAELANQNGIKSQLKRIHQYGKLNRIVLDEFDVAGEAQCNFREVYTHIIPTLRALVPSVPFSLLSATTCKPELLHLVRGLNDHPNRDKPHIFFHKRPISDSLAFSVERKESDKKVAKRIRFILKSYEEKHTNDTTKPKTICYCLTKGNCHRMNTALRELGMKSEVITSETRDRCTIVQKLKDGKIQIICATKALGRGVDVNDVRFIFHTTLPCSMHDYVQETGRAGRDNVPSYCVLFYRPHDQAQTEHVTGLLSVHGTKEGLGVLTGEARRKTEELLKKVIKYATHADENMCRYSFLASQVTVSEAVVNEDGEESCLRCQEPSLCDLCSIRLEKDPFTVFPLKEENQIFRDEDENSNNNNKIVGNVQLKSLNINPLVKLFLKRYEEGNVDIDRSALLLSKCHKLLIECIKKVNEEVGSTFASLEEKIPQSFLTGEFPVSLRMDFFRYLKSMGIMDIKGLSGRCETKYLLRTNEFFVYHEKIKTDQIRFLLTNVRCFTGIDDVVMEDEYDLVAPSLDVTLGTAATNVAVTTCSLDTSTSASPAATLGRNTESTTENITTPLLPSRNVNIRKDDSFYNMPSTPTATPMHSTPTANSFVTPTNTLSSTKRTNNLVASLSYPKKTTEQVKEANALRDMMASTTSTQSKLHHQSQYAVAFRSNMATPSLLSAKAARDNSIRVAISRNHQGLICPRLKMNKELVDMHTFSGLPFLVQYELYRLYNQENKKTPIKEFVQIVKEKLSDISWDWHNDQHNSCRFLNEAANTIHHMSTYNHILKIATETNISVDEGVSAGSLLYFSATFGANGTDQLILRPPETGADRRIYRKYGSHRFLEVQIHSDVIRKHIQTLLHRRDPLWICGRTYSFLWAKATKTPQSYVLFAESGVGIAPDDEMTVDEVRHWCLCRELNPDMTVGKEHKRMKLNFSKTTPTYVLPDHCLEVIDDVKGDGDNILTDGCGLISAEALKHIWNCYKAQDKKRSGYLKKNLNELMSSAAITENELLHETCEFTSFQGRIGGFKGMWVLDNSLEGIKVICRESQLKYILPMKSMCEEKINRICNDLQLSPDTLDYDEFYDTVDICSWDKGPELGKLNLRVIQILEQRGVSIDFFKQRVDEAMEWIEKLKEGGSNSILMNLRTTQAIEARIEKAAGDMFDDDLIFRMAAVSVPRNEPVFAQLVDQRVRKEANATRKKAKYPLRHCYHLRMFPDHTGLLEENEAFVAGLSRMYGNADIALFQHLVAMRSPAYFAGDLLKLKIVSMTDIIRRSILAGKETSPFFGNLHTGLILSTKGKRSCADMMSGGDFDGDKAWVCWDPLLTEQVCDGPPPITSSPDYIIHKSDKESELAFTSKIFDRISFSWNFRHHQSSLGILSNTLDSTLDNLGFDSEEAKIIGREAFLQVDHPYQIRRIPDKIRKKLNEIKEPHWKGFKTNTYKSNKALGIIWDYIEEKINSVREHNKQNFTKKAQVNPHIMYHIHKKVDSVKETNDVKGAEFLINLREKMKNAAKQYYFGIHEYLRDNEPKANDDFDPLYWNWLKGRHDHWRKKLFDKTFDEDLTLAAAVLYEQVWEYSVEKSTPDDEKVYKFAWQVAHDILTRIIADGTARERGSGLAICIDREIEKDLFDCFKKK